MDTFTIRDLREKTGDLVRDAETGKLSLVTKHGKPLFLAVPMDETLLQYGLNTSLAIDLFRQETVTLAKAAKIAGMSIEAFMEKLAVLNIPAVSYSASELKEELANLEK